LPDGLTIGVPGRSWFVEGAIRVQGVRFDPTKFSYVGSPGAANSVVYVRSSTGVKSFEDLKASKRTLSFGALGSLTPTAMVPYMLAAQGMPIRVVVGYVSSARHRGAPQAGGRLLHGRGVVRRVGAGGKKIIIPSA
jgi:ABC-type nitrate/sulfonate/bicarbonate transport system substrate-binding protein